MMVKTVWDYRWSSVHAHINGKYPLGIVDAQKLLEICGDWKTAMVGFAPPTYKKNVFMLNLMALRLRSLK